jgi:hypothetical protein
MSCSWVVTEKKEVGQQTMSGRQETALFVRIELRDGSGTCFYMPCTREQFDAFVVGESVDVVPSKRLAKGKA